MVVLGVLLLVVVVVVSVSVVVGGAGAVTFTLLGLSIETTARTLYLMGLVSLLVAVLGVILIMRGMRHQRQIRRENRTLKREVRSAHDQPTGTDGTRTASADDHYETNPRE